MVTRTDKNLSGQRNQCGACGDLFNSNFAFEKHRTGDFWSTNKPASRRCKTADEMRQAGMAINSAGFWVSSVYSGPAHGEKQAA